MRRAATAQPQNSIQHQSLLCIHVEVIKARVEGNMDSHHVLLGDRGVSSKVTLNSLNTNSSKKIKKEKLNKIVDLY